MKQKIIAGFMIFLIIGLWSFITIFCGYQIGHGYGIRESCKKTYQECLPGWGCKEFTYP